MKMRLDKFLKISRLIRRRTLAKQIADQERVKVNGQLAKPATTVAIGDKIEIQFGQTLLTVEVMKIKQHVQKDEAETLYQVVAEEKIE